MSRSPPYECISAFVCFFIYALLYISLLVVSAFPYHYLSPHFELVFSAFSSQIQVSESSAVLCFNCFLPISRQSCDSC
jgi:hypothetical protein